MQGAERELNDCGEPSEPGLRLVAPQPQSGTGNIRPQTKVVYVCTLTVYA